MQLETRGFRAGAHFYVVQQSIDLGIVLIPRGLAAKRPCCGGPSRAGLTKAIVQLKTRGFRAAAHFCIIQQSMDFGMVLIPRGLAAIRLVAVARPAQGWQQVLLQQETKGL